MWPTANRTQRTGKSQTFKRHEIKSETKPMISSTEELDKSTALNAPQVTTTLYSNTVPVKTVATNSTNTNDMIDNIPAFASDPTEQAIVDHQNNDTLITSSSSSSSFVSTHN